VSTTVLIADNHDDHYLQMEATLLQEGYNVERVCSGEDALLRCSSLPPVNIVLLDVSLPGKNNHLITQHLRSDRFPPLIFILIAGFSLAAVSLAMAWGCKEFLSKPVGRTELLAVVKKWSHKVPLSK